MLPDNRKGKKTGSVRLPHQVLSAELSPAAGSSSDERTADLVWYTGATVRRAGWDGPWLLTLSLRPSHVRMERLKSGKAPLLNSHGSWSLSDVIGIVESADIHGKAKVRFSKRLEVDAIWNDVADGIIRNASVGAAIYKLKDVTEKDEDGNSKMKSYLAVDWEPLEVSLVPIGADPNAGLGEPASDQLRFTEAEILAASGDPGDFNFEVERESLRLLGL